MRYELRRRLTFLAHALAAIGQRDNARALTRRIADGSAVAWLHTDHGEHVWAEVAGGLEVAKAIGPAYLAKLVAHADHAFAEAEALLAEELPRPAAVPAEHRPTVPSNVVVLRPRRSTPPRAA
jgi:hypothetical protein